MLPMKIRIYDLNSFYDCTKYIVTEKDEGDMKSVESQLFEVFLNTVDFVLIWFGLVLCLCFHVHLWGAFTWFHLIWSHTMKNYVCQDVAFQEDIHI